MNQSYHTTFYRIREKLEPSKKMIDLKLLTACLFMLFASVIMAQSDKLLITGRLKIDRGTIKDARVILEKDGRKVRTITSESRFEIGLDFQAIYVVSFEKEGFVTKRIRFDTHVPPERIEYGFVPFDFTVEIFEQYDDVNMVMFNQPVGKIAFNDLIDEFDYDTDYTKSIQARLDQVMEEIEEKKEEKATEEAAAAKAEEELNEQVEDLMNDAQKAMDSGNPDEAIKKLQEASKLKDDLQIQQQLQQANELKAELAAEQEKKAAGEALLEKANAARTNGDLDGAKLNLEAAAVLIEDDKRVRDILADLNDAIIEQAEAQAEFSDLSKSAEDALAAGNFKEAMNLADKALEIKQDDTVESIKKQAADAAENEADDEIASLYKEADDLINEENYAEAMSSGVKKSNEQLADTIQKETERQNPTRGKNPDVNTGSKASMSTARVTMESDEPPLRVIKGDAVVISESRIGKEALKSPTAQMSEDDLYDRVLKKVEEEQRQMVYEEEQRILKEKYPRRKTTETEKEGNSTITYVYINRGDFVNVHKKVEHTWGGVFYFINGQATNARFWVHETQ